MTTFVGIIRSVVIVIVVVVVIAVVVADVDAIIVVVTAAAAAATTTPTTTEIRAFAYWTRRRTVITRTVTPGGVKKSAFQVAVELSEEKARVVVLDDVEFLFGRAGLEQVL